MLRIALSSIAILSALILLGWPLSAITFLKKSEKVKFELSFIIATALVIGFAISAFAASFSYSFIGVDYYFQIIFLIGFVSWTFFLIFRNRLYFPTFKKSIFYIISSFFLVSLFFSKTQWDEVGRPILFSGAGPDVPQNLLAAKYASDLGSTWFAALDNVFKGLNVETFDDATFKMFEFPSYSSLAVMDYLVFGVRWGLTIPFNQLLRIFGPQLIWSEVGIVLVITIFSLLLLSFLIFKLIISSNLVAFFFALALALNGSFINQYFNGGLSQGVGLIGNMAILLVIILITSKQNFLASNSIKIGTFILATSGYLISSTAYIDGTFAPAVIVTLITLFYLFINRKIMISCIKYLVIPGLLSLLLTPLLTYIVFTNLDGRLAAASGTGASTGVWKLPPQLVGFFSQYSFLSEKENTIFTLLSILLCVMFSILLFKGLGRQRIIELPYVILGISSTFVVMIGFMIGYYGRVKSDYLYNKLTTYTAPFLVVSFFTLMYLTFNSKRLRPMLLPSVSILTLTVVFSALHVENQFSKDTYAIIKTPYEFNDLVKDQELFNYLNSNNYIMPYKPAYSFAGLFGVKYWISKSPNELNLVTRLNKPLKLMCFAGDPVCTPKTDEVTNPRLKEFGIVEFVSELDTLGFSKLSVQDRYNYVFDSFQQPRATIPEKFLGGNPYFK
jgi:hypothetical protein